MAKLIQKNVNPTAILSTPHQTWKERVVKKLLSFPLLASMITFLFLMANKVMAQEYEVMFGNRVSTDTSIYRKLLFLSLLVASFFASFILSMFEKISWHWLIAVFLLSSCYVMMIEILERLCGVNLINFIIIGIVLALFFLTFVLALFQKIKIPLKNLYICCGFLLIGMFVYLVLRWRLSIFPDKISYQIYLIWAAVPFAFLVFFMLRLFSLKKVGLSVVLNAAVLFLIYSFCAMFLAHAVVPYYYPYVNLVDFVFLFFVVPFCLIWTICHPEKTKMGKIILSILFSINLTIFLAFFLWICFLSLF